VARQNSSGQLNSKRGWPWVTTGLVCLQVYVFSCEKRAMQWGIINYLLDDFAFSWTHFLANPFSQTPNLVSHTFLHANEAHIIGNLLFFLLFAPAVERTMGSLFFLVSYVFWGCVAALTQGFFSPFTSGLIGASGAISGAAGAFFVLYPLRMPVTFLAPVFGRIMAKIPAFFFIGLWFVGQLHDGFQSLMPAPFGAQITPIAHWAHIGGFAAGALTVVPFLFKNVQSSGT